MSWAIEEKDYSQRRACGLVGIEPKTYRYGPCREQDGVLRTRLKELGLNAAGSAIAGCTCWSNARASR